MKALLRTWIVKSAAWSARGYREKKRTCEEGGSVGKIEGTEVGRSGRRIQDQDSARLGLWEEWLGWGVGPLANKVWIQPEYLAGSAPRPCGHEDLGRILKSPGVWASGAAQQASVRKQQQAGCSSRGCVHCRMHVGEVRLR